MDVDTANELYIINNAGNILFYKSLIEDKICEQQNNQMLMASFLAAVLQFAQTVHGDNLNNFEMANHRVVIVTNHEYRINYVIISGKKGRNQKQKNLEKKIS